MDGRVNGWMDEWATSLLSYFSTERPLRWGTSCLSYFFSEHLCYFFFDPDLSCLPASSSIAFAAQFFSARSCYNAFSNLQLQSRIAQEWVALWSRTTCRAAITLRLAPSSCNPACQERSRSANSADLFRLCCPLVFYVFLMNSSSRAHFADLVSQKRSEHASFLTCWNANRALAAVWCTFCQPDLPRVPRASS